MTLIAFTVPDDPAALPAWLERRLLVPDFGRFVAELSAVSPTDGTESAKEILGGWYEPALASGFAEVPAERLRNLLAHPRCLFDLQEAILTEGGPHWGAVTASTDEFKPAVANGKVSLGKLLAEPPAPNRRPTKRERTYKTWAMVATALAACLLIAVGYLAWPSDAGALRGKFEQVAWGWGRPGGLATAAADRAAYLNGLAKAAEEWFEQRPTAASVVAQRIGELRAGCSKLILSNYGPLPPNEKAWLVAKCREWAAVMDAKLAAVEGGADPVALRGEVDELVRAVLKTLRDRAADRG